MKQRGAELRAATILDGRSAKVIDGAVNKKKPPRGSPLAAA